MTLEEKQNLAVRIIQHVESLNNYLIDATCANMEVKITVKPQEYILFTGVKKPAIIEIEIRTKLSMDE